MPIRLDHDDAHSFPVTSWRIEGLALIGEKRCRLLNILLKVYGSWLGVA